MSDAGTYEAGELEIAAALEGIPGIVSVAPTMDLRGLIQQDGVAKPSIGIIATGMVPEGQLGVGNRRFSATVTWQIAIAVNDGRGAINARGEVQRYLEAIRDRLHYLQSALAPKARYLSGAESWPEQQPEALCVAAVDYKLNLILGN